MCHYIISDCLHRRGRAGCSFIFQHNGLVISLDERGDGSQDTNGIGDRVIAVVILSQHKAMYVADLFNEDGSR